MLDAPEPPLDADVVALGVSTLAATGAREIVGRAATRSPPTRRPQQLLVPETTDACESLQASSAPGFIRPPWMPTANPSNARIAVEPFTERKHFILLVTPSLPADGTVEWR